MKVLMISSDRGVFEPESKVALRMKAYAERVEELHIIVLSSFSQGFKNTQLAPNLWIYPTNSTFKLKKPFDALELGKKLIKEKGFVRGKSVITTQDPFECGWAGKSISKYWKIPLEVQLHTDPFSPLFSGPPNQVRKIIAHSILAYAKRIRVVSRGVEKKLAQNSFLAPKLFVLPIAVDQEKIEKSTPQFDLHARYKWPFILLSVARLEKEKNLDKVLLALSEVRKKHSEVGLVMVGKGSQEKHLKALAQKLNLDDYIKFEGWQNDLASFYKTANLFIQTSRFEGYGLSLIEAGLSGLPVVSTPVGIAQELTPNKDFYLVQYDDTEVLANAINDLIENTFKRENLRLNLKNTLESKLISEKEFNDLIVANWEKCSNLIS